MVTLSNTSEDLLALYVSLVASLLYDSPSDNSVSSYLSSAGPNVSAYCDSSVLSRITSFLEAIFVEVYVLVATVIEPCLYR